MSMKKMGRLRRWCMARSTTSRVMTYSGADVELITMSAAARCCSSWSNGTARPPTLWASFSEVSKVRFATRMRSMPCALRCVAVSSLVSPAPTMSTVWSLNLPNTCRASSTAAELTLTGRSPMDVSVRTRLPTSSACRNRRLKTTLVQPPSHASWYAPFIWATIWASPTTMESRLEVTRKRCAIAPSPE